MRSSRPPSSALTRRGRRVTALPTPSGRNASAPIAAGRTLPVCLKRMRRPNAVGHWTTASCSGPRRRISPFGRREKEAALWPKPETPPGDVHQSLLGSRSIETPHPAASGSARHRWDPREQRNLHRGSTARRPLPCSAQAVPGFRAISPGNWNRPCQAALRLTRLSASAVNFWSVAFSSWRFSSSTLAQSWRPSCLAKAIKLP